MHGLIKIVAALAVFAASSAFGVPVDSAKLGVMNQFKSKTEPTAKAALWTSPTVFKVGVLDNGSDRGFYAQCVCGVMADNGIKGVSVQVIDVVQLVRKDKWVKLGESRD